MAVPLYTASQVTFFQAIIGHPAQMYKSCSVQPHASSNSGFLLSGTIQVVNIYPHTVLSEPGQGIWLWLRMVHDVTQCSRNLKGQL